MKILIVSDIHANWVALSAIKETFDVCLCVGDVVDYGTDPVPCVEWVQKHALKTVRGNHDHAIAQRIAGREGSGLKSLSAASRTLHWKLLSDQHLYWLSQLPVTEHFTLDQKQFYMVHATPRDPMDEYLALDEKAWKRQLQDIKADFVLVGHTHIPFHIDLGDKQVINPGSVGQPRDGDPRSSYAVIENGRVSLHRVDYDIEATVEQMNAVEFPQHVLELSELVLTTGGSTSKIH